MEAPIRISSETPIDKADDVGTTHPMKQSTVLSKREKRREFSASLVVALISDASMFGVAERGLWHSNNMNAPLPRNLWSFKDGIAIISATTTIPESQLGRRSRAERQGDLTISSSDPRFVLRLSPTTTARYLYTSYRVVFAIDASPSMFAIDPHSSSVPYEDSSRSIETIVRSLVMPLVWRKESAESTLNSIHGSRLGTRKGSLDGVRVAGIEHESVSGSVSRLIESHQVSYVPEIFVSAFVSRGTTANINSNISPSPPLKPRCPKCGGLINDRAYSVTTSAMSPVSYSASSVTGTSETPLVSLPGYPSNVRNSSDAESSTADISSVGQGLGLGSHSTSNGSGAVSSSSDSLRTGLPPIPPLSNSHSTYNQSPQQSPPTHGHVHGGGSDSESTHLIVHDFSLVPETADVLCERLVVGMRDAMRRWSSQSYASAFKQKTLQTLQAQRASQPIHQCHCNTEVYDVPSYVSPPVPEGGAGSADVGVESVPEELKASHLGSSTPKFTVGLKHSTSGADFVVPAATSSTPQSSPFHPNLTPTGSSSYVATPVTPTHTGSTSVPQSHSLAPLLETSVSLMKLLPSHAAPAIIVFTDGVSARVGKEGTYGGALLQLQRHDIAVSFVQAGSCSGVHASLGVVPDPDQLQFIASATGGFRIRGRDMKHFVSPPPAPQQRPGIPVSAAATGVTVTPASANAESISTSFLSSTSHDGPFSAASASSGSVSSRDLLVHDARVTVTSTNTVIGQVKPYRHNPVPPPFSTSQWSYFQTAFFLRASVLTPSVTAPLVTQERVRSSSSLSYSARSVLSRIQGDLLLSSRTTSLPPFRPLGALSSPGAMHYPHSSVHVGPHGLMPGATAPGGAEGVAALLGLAITAGPSSNPLKSWSVRPSSLTRPLNQGDARHSGPSSSGNGGRSRSKSTGKDFVESVMLGYPWRGSPPEISLDAACVGAWSVSARPSIIFQARLKDGFVLIGQSQSVAHFYSQNLEGGSGVTGTSGSAGLGSGGAGASLSPLIRPCDELSRKLLDDNSRRFQLTRLLLLWQPQVIIIYNVVEEIQGPATASLSENLRTTAHPTNTRAPPVAVPPGSSSASFPTSSSQPASGKGTILGVSATSNAADNLDGSSTEPSLGLARSLSSVNPHTFVQSPGSTSDRAQTHTQKLTPRRSERPLSGKGQVDTTEPSRMLRISVDIVSRQDTIRLFHMLNAAERSQSQSHSVGNHPDIANQARRGHHQKSSLLSSTSSTSIPSAAHGSRKIIDGSHLSTSVTGNVGTTRFDPRVTFRGPFVSSTTNSKHVASLGAGVSTGIGVGGSGIVGVGTGLSRLTRSAAENERLRALTGFVSVLAQNDLAAAVLSNQRGWSSLSELPKIKYRRFAFGNEMKKPDGFSFFSDVLSNSAAKIPDSTSASEKLASQVVPMSPLSEQGEGGKISSVSIVEQSSDVTVEKNVFEPALTSGSTEAPDVKGKSTVVHVLPPEQLLTYASFGSLSLSAWHRWMDVERIEFALPLSDLLHADLDFDYSGALDGFYHNVCRGLRSWAHAVIPSAHMLFASSGLYKDKEREKGKDRTKEERVKEKESREKEKKWKDRALDDVSVLPSHQVAESALHSEMKDSSPFSMKDFLLSDCCAPGAPEAAKFWEGACQHLYLYFPAAAHSVEEDNEQHSPLASKDSIFHTLPRLPSKNSAGFSKFIMCRATRHPTKSGVAGVYIAFFGCPPPLRSNLVKEINATIQTHLNVSYTPKCPIMRVLVDVGSTVSLRHEGISASQTSQINSASSSKKSQEFLADGEINPTEEVAALGVELPPTACCGGTNINKRLLDSILLHVDSFNYNISVPPAFIQPHSGNLQLPRLTLNKLLILIHQKRTWQNFTSEVPTLLDSLFSSTINMDNPVFAKSSNVVESEAVEETNSQATSPNEIINQWTVVDINHCAHCSNSHLALTAAANVPSPKQLFTLQLDHIVKSPDSGDIVLHERATLGDRKNIVLGHVPRLSVPIVLQVLLEVSLSKNGRLNVSGELISDPTAGSSINSKSIYSIL